MRLRNVLGLVSLAAGCASADRTAPAASRDPLERIASTSPEVAQLLARALPANGLRLASRPTNLARAIRAEVPTAANGALRLGVDDLSDVRVSTEGVDGVAITSERTILHASRASTVVYFATATAIEQLVRLESNAALAWSLTLPEGATLRRVDDGHGGTIEVVRDGIPRLRMTADRAWDANGRAIAVSLALEGARVVAKVPNDAAYPVVIDPAWSSTTTPVRLRSGHTATVLGDGRVLIAGGSGTASAELFDSVTGRFRPTGSMSAVRNDGAATLMADGRVLLVGGGGGSTAEIYDPSTGAFAPTGSTSVAHGARTGAVKLANDKILVSGGSSSVAELFDPATGTFSVPAGKGAATGRPARMANGKVYIPGREKSDIYDPATGTWASVASPTDIYDQPVALRDGRVLTFGIIGVSSGGSGVVYVQSAYLFDPATGNTVLASKPQHPGGAQSLLLPSGKVMHIGIDGAESWDSATGTWTNLPSPPTGHVGATLSQLPSGDVLAFGGSAGSVDLFLAQDVSGAGTFTTAGSFSGERINARATLLLDGRVLLVGGYATGSAGVPSTTFDLYDPATNTFSGARPLAAGRNNQAQTLLANGKVLVVGGGPSSAELFDPTSNTSTATGSMSVARGRSGIARLADGKVLVAGGGNSTAELYDPAAGTFSATGAMTTSRGDCAAVLLASGKVLVTDGNTSDLYDTQSKTFTAAAPPVSAGRDIDLAVLMLGGDVLLGGGSVTAFDRYDPTATSAFMTAEVAEVSQGRAAAALPFGRVLVVGGIIGPEGVRNTALAFSPIAAAGKGDFGPLGPLAIGVHSAAATWLPRGGALVAGGSACETCAPSLSSSNSLFKDRAQDAWRPTITTASPTVAAGAKFTIAGTKLTGVVDGSAPNPVFAWIPASTQGQILGRVTKFTATSAELTLPATALHGPGFLVASVDGITSSAVPLTITPAPQGTSCAYGAECTSGFCVDGVCCDSACNGTCQACTAARKGSGVDGACGAIPPGKDPKDACALFQGAPCTAGAECATGLCVDGVCCDTACTGQCEACNVEGSSGVCVPVLGKPHGSRTMCDAGDGTCGARQCNGTARDTCAGFEPNTTSCRTASCKDGVETAAASCTGSGECPAAVTKNCEPFACGDTACLTKCSVDAECAPSYRCTEGKCVTGAFCDGDHTVQIPGGASTDCAPYRCEGDHCKSSCGSSADCVGGFLCSSGTCVAASTGPVEDSGGCSVATHPTGFRGFLVALATCTAIALRRRRRRW